MMFGSAARLYSLAVAWLFLLGTGVTIFAGPQRPAPAAVFTAAQATAGGASYQAICSGCHSVDLSGNGDAPALAGGSFMETWRTQTTGDLLKYAQGMPPGGPHLTADEYVQIVAYILQQNGAAAGDQPFTAATAASIGAIATGERPAAPNLVTPPGVGQQ